MFALVCSDCGEYRREKNKCIKCGCEYLSWIDKDSDDPYKDIRNNTYPRLDKFRDKIIKSIYTTKDNQKLRFEDTEGGRYEIGIKNHSKNSYIREIRGNLSSLIGEKISFIDTYTDNIYDFDTNTVYTIVFQEGKML